MSWLLTPLLAALAVWWLLAGMGRVSDGGGEEGRRQLEDTLRRAAVSCYAAEGVYPPTLSYLEEHYGVQIDASAYTVYYSVFADNLMPDITVLEN